MHHPGFKCGRKSIMWTWIPSMYDFIVSHWTFHNTCSSMTWKRREIWVFNWLGIRVISRHICEFIHRFTLLLSCCSSLSHLTLLRAHHHGNHGQLRSSLQSGQTSHHTRWALCHPPRSQPPRKSHHTYRPVPPHLLRRYWTSNHPTVHQ